MGRPGVQMWSWALCVLLGQMCLKQVTAGPLYMVVVPAVLEAGAQTQFCANLLQPTENLLMTITLTSDEKVMTLLNKRSNTAFNICTAFRVPLVQKDVIQNFTVEVRGGTFYSQEVMRVMFKVYKPATFIQTDKPIYLPGQTVNFRIVTLDTKLRPVNQLYDTIEIQDVNKNRIGQWLNETSGGKILQLLYPLNSDAREGIYTITVSIGDQTVSQDFKVEKYVLPKFGVTIAASDEVSVGQTEITADVCAEYTYGQPVPGSVKVSMCRPVQQYYYIPVPADVTAPCYNDTKQTNKTGCARFSFKMSTFTKADKVLQDVLDLLASVEEGGTGVSQKAEKLITVSFVLGKLSFTEVPKIYVKGSTIQGKVSAVDYSNAPIPNMELYLFEGEIWSQSQPLQNFTTDSNGVATFSFSTKDYSGNIHLYVSNTPVLTYPPYRTPYYEAGDITLSLAQPVSADTQTASSLVVTNKDNPLSCNVKEKISIQYTVVGEPEGNVYLMYLVISRGAIAMQGFQKIHLPKKSVVEGEVSFELKVSPEMAPVVQVVAYSVLPSETVIASSTDFTTEKCFRNNVSVAFFPPSAVPGEMTNLQVTADPGSLCGVSAVDQSVFIMEPGKNLNADKIFNLLPVTQASYIPYEVQDPTECLLLRARRAILPYPRSDDAFTVLQNVGLKMATNLFFRIPSCIKFKGRLYYLDGGISYGFPMVEKMNLAMAAPVGAVMAPNVPLLGGAVVDTNAPPLVTVRVFFPETWLWQLVDIGMLGKKNVSLTVPDTITTWETEAFCLSPQGFGLAPREQIKVFQPFFLELTLPYSIIRGENFVLKATVFNYLSSCIMVSVTPKPSVDYILTPLSGNQYLSCLCGSERKTFSWTLGPITLGSVNVSVTAEAVASLVPCQNAAVSRPERGRIDVVTKPLIVKAEGSEVTQTYNWLLCPKGQSLTDEKTVQLPKNMIVGSARGSVSVLGDILGRALQNLDGLLQMPSGCGEQNMALLAPDIYILQYLTDTNQLTTATREKATKFLISGVQRQFNYKDNAGAYSTFGSGPGNTWLTAFVVRCFVKAQSFIYIDPTTIDQSKTWLIGKQKTTGCFEMSGKLFHSTMKGGVADEVSLSAYITAAFLEMDMPVDSPVMTNSLSCLRNYTKINDTYTTALLAYVFTLAGDMETRSLLLQQLDTVSIKQGGFLYWSQSSVETSASLSVEISSYVLLAKLSASPTAEDLGYCSSIVRWLTGQQNQYGGFSSTQDTVVALQALALYSALVFSPTGSSTVTVQSPISKLTFDVNQNNKLLYQEKKLQPISGKYSVTVKGSACASVQISITFNVPTPSTVKSLSVMVKPESNTCQSATSKVTLRITSLYNGTQKGTNMVIVDITMLSGFVPDPESLKNLQTGSQVAKVEQTQDRVVIYIPELLTGTAVDCSLDLVEEVRVQKRKAAVVKIYDYYLPSNQAQTEYVDPCAAA
ncbi:alpha-2-macroglobulin-like protein 1 [Betta splendens]|uniref:Alpha-2-macroglobulin-like protein 1 n=1 Tax=Betta splendens TaxID=158456 RepID=A0A6P7PEA5_BETSP|nr:alpha-2-macroglobulin-like protein 1 [Betta splendens]XP_055369806.1 alpha-2-macroglobulin-like protein 1 [Betta splendens]